MKNLFLCLLVLGLIACEEKSQFDPPTPYKLKKPVADFQYKVLEFGQIAVNFTVNKGDSYTFDLGDGRVMKGSFDDKRWIYPVEFISRFKVNGNHKITLNVSNAKGKASQQKIITIENAEPDPVASFSYEIKDNGVVKFNNLSKNNHLNRWRFTKKGDPTGHILKHTGLSYTFENNGVYYLHLTAINKYGTTSFARDSVTISNSLNNNNPTFEGTFFNKNGKITGEGINTFEESWGIMAFHGLSCYSFLVRDVGNIFIINGEPPMTLSLEDKHNFLIERLKKGPADKKIWNVIIRKGEPFWVGDYREAYSVSKDPAAEIEILEIEETKHPKLFPDVHEKAFWVTLRIKVDMGIKGKVDGKLRMRYLVY